MYTHPKLCRLQVHHHWCHREVRTPSNIAKSGFECICVSSFSWDGDSGCCWDLQWAHKNPVLRWPVPHGVLQISPSCSVWSLSKPWPLRAGAQPPPQGILWGCSAPAATQTEAGSPWQVRVWGSCAQAHADPAGSWELRGEKPRTGPCWLHKPQKLWNYCHIRRSDPILVLHPMWGRSPGSFSCAL